MPNLGFSFIYYRDPVIPISVLGNNKAVSSQALVATGAQLTILEEEIAGHLGIRLDGAPEVRIRGLVDQAVRARLAQVEIWLLNEPYLRLEIEVAFVGSELTDTNTGNVLGLDVLDHFDLALEHAKRLGYIGRTS